MILVRSAFPVIAAELSIFFSSPLIGSTGQYQCEHDHKGEYTSSTRICTSYFGLRSACIKVRRKKNAMLSCREYSIITGVLISEQVRETNDTLVPDREGGNYGCDPVENWAPLTHELGKGRAYGLSHFILPVFITCRPPPPLVGAETLTCLPLFFSLFILVVVIVEFISPCSSSVLHCEFERLGGRT